MYLTDKEAQDLIIDIGRRMSAARFVTANDGNLTERVSDDEVWATPTGVNKGELTREMLLKVRISDGKILEGTWKPTSEIYMHLNAYRTDDTLVSTAHAHPLFLTTLACAGIDLDLPTTPAAVSISGRVPVIPFVNSGSAALAESIIPYVKLYNVVNLGNHGPIAWGHTPNEAWYRLEDAEASAHLAIELLRLGRLRPITADQVEEILYTHKVEMPETAKMKQFTETNNGEVGVSFTDFFKSQFRF